MRQDEKDETQGLIYVQIAAYRDPQLLPTVEDMLSKASNPGALTFGICWQYGPEEEHLSLGPIFDCNKITARVEKISHTESKGLGWARSRTNALYGGEEFTLQIDSHHRFVQGWDAMLLEDYRQAALFSDKPIVTTYLPPFELGKPLPEALPTLMSQYEFSPDRLLMSRPWYIPPQQNPGRVVRARTLSAHFLFARGSFVEEVPYDPDAFFGGYVEEVTMSARAYTHGWDFFSPHRCYCYHEYTRVGRPKIWEDKPADTVQWDALARNRARQLQGQEDHGLDLGRFGLGSARSFRDWEVFAGLDFAGGNLQQYTLDVREPPNPLPYEDGFNCRTCDTHATTFPTTTFSTKVLWNPDILLADVKKAQPSKKLSCLTLGFETSDGKCLQRSDMLPSTHTEIFKHYDDQNEKEESLPSASIDVAVATKGENAPTTWVMWPVFTDKTNGEISWGTRQAGKILNCES